VLDNSDERSRDPAWGPRCLRFLLAPLMRHAQNWIGTYRSNLKVAQRGLSPTQRAPADNLVSGML